MQVTSIKLSYPEVVGEGSSTFCEYHAPANQSSIKTLRHHNERKCRDLSEELLIKHNVSAASIDSERHEQLDHIAVQETLLELQRRQINRVADLSLRHVAIQEQASTTQAGQEIPPDASINAPVEILPTIAARPLTAKDVPRGRPMTIQLDPK